MASVFSLFTTEVLADFLNHCIFCRLFGGPTVTTFWGGSEVEGMKLLIYDFQVFAIWI